MLHQLMHVVCINLYIITNIICGETPYIVGVRRRVPQYYYLGVIKV